MVSPLSVVALKGSTDPVQDAGSSDPARAKRRKWDAVTQQHFARGLPDVDCQEKTRVLYLAM